MKHWYPERLLRSCALAATLMLGGGGAWADTTQLLTNGGFETPYNAVSNSNANGSYTGQFPANWTENSLIGGAHVNNTYSQETSNTISGSAFKAVIDYASGFSTGARFAIYQQANAISGRPLTASVWLKATANCTVLIYFQQAASPFAGRGSKSCAVTTSWQQFTYTLTPSNTEVVDMLLLCTDQTVAKPVTLWLDEASLTVQETHNAYIVSPSGSDTTGNGSLATPYQTIAKALTQVYPGDTVQLRAGTYRETVTPTQNGTATAPITITNYNGEAATVSGADIIPGPWTAGSNGIYTASSSLDLGEGFNQVFVDGAMVNEAREPNYGSGDVLHPGTTPMTVAAIGTQTSSTAPVDSTITSTTFSGKPANFYVGARLHAGVNLSWAWQIGTVSSSTGSTVTVPATSENTSWWWTGSGNGYLYGLLSLLDADNEWFLTSASQTLSLRITGQADPTSHLVEMRNRTYTVNYNGKNYITIQGLTLRSGDVQMNGTGDVLDTCDAGYLTHFLTYSYGGIIKGGIQASGTNDTISNCTIHDTAGCGIQLHGSGHLVTRNTIYNTDYSGTYSNCLAVNGTGHTISFNTIHHSGRDLIQFGGGAGSSDSGHTFIYNDVYEPGQMCKDLGCIYAFACNAQGTTGNPTRIAYNWIHDHDTDGNPTGTSLLPLIYLDNWCRNFVIDHNVCWNGVRDAGIRLNGPNSGHLIYHNTLYNCDDANTHTFTLAFSDSGNPDPTYWYTGGTYAAPDIRNHLYLNSTPDTQLTDSGARNFFPKPGAAAIDAGTVIPGYDNSYVGAAPDLGAYEAGGAYWIPGVNGWTVDQPGSTSSAASSVAATTATANGTLISAGTAPTTITIYWGTSDGGTSTGAWANSTTLGTTYTGSYLVLAPSLSGLTPGATYYYRYLSSNANGGTWSSAQNFTTFTLLQQWKLTTLGSTTASNTADPNANGIVNLLEYAINGDPSGYTTGTGVLPQVSRSGANHLQITFARRTDRGDVTMIVQGADALAGPWTNLASSTTGSAFSVLTGGASAGETGSGTIRTVTVADAYAVGDPAHPQRFMRLQVTNP